MTSPRKTGKAFDRSIVDGPISGAVWKLAWPTMLQNVIGGMQGIVDHAMVGNYVGYEGNAAIGVSWQIFLVVIVFITSLFTGMGILVARFTGANEREKVNRTVYQAFLTAVILAVGIMAPVGYFLSPFLLDLVNAAPGVQAGRFTAHRVLPLPRDRRGAGRGVQQPARPAPLQRLARVPGHDRAGVPGIAAR